MYAAIFEQVLKISLLRTKKGVKIKSKVNLQDWNTSKKVSHFYANKDEQKSWNVSNIRFGVFQKYNIWTKEEWYLLYSMYCHDSLSIIYIIIYIFIIASIMFKIIFYHQDSDGHWPHFYDNKQTQTFIIYTHYFSLKTSH